MEESRKCEFCGKEFIAHRIDSRFCSISCRDKQHYRKNHVPKNKETYLKACKLCGKEFQSIANPGSGSRAKYCSPECRRAANSKAKAESYIPHPLALAEPRECVYCGKTFAPDIKHSYSTTCSYVCHYKHKNEERSKERAAKREEVLAKGQDCVVCGEHFIPSSYGNIYCSDECKRERIKATAKQVETPEIKERKKESNFRNRLQGNYAKVLARDNGICQFCGSIINPQVHHLNGLGEARMPDGTRKRYSCDHSLSNLITLCSTCHRAMHNNLLVKKKGEWYIKGTMFKQLGLTGTIKILND